MGAQLTSTSCPRKPSLSVRIASPASTPSTSTSACTAPPSRSVLPALCVPFASLHRDDGYPGCPRAPSAQQGCVDQGCQERPPPYPCAMREAPQRRRGCQGEALHHCDPRDGGHHWS